MSLDTCFSFNRDRSGRWAVAIVVAVRWACGSCVMAIAAWDPVAPDRAGGGSWHVAGMWPAGGGDGQVAATGRWRRMAGGGGWPVAADGRWRMAGGGCPVADGRWRMGGGGWAVAAGM